MIPYNAVTEWSVTHPWATREQVEQDLLLSKAICDIFSNEMLFEELIFRGGTALNKLILKEPYRYSEDLDFVRTNVGGIGEIMKNLSTIGNATGYRVTTRIGKFPKLYWHTTSQTGLPLRIKIEINTQERISALPVTAVRHSVKSSWFSGEATVRAYQFEEIAATKIRALYQRSKGRDLFDLWLLTTEIGIDTALACEAFSTYRPSGYTGQKGIENLELKIKNKGFISDMSNLVSPRITNYHPEAAADLVIREYLDYL